MSKKKINYQFSAEDLVFFYKLRALIQFPSKLTAADDGAGRKLFTMLLNRTEDRIINGHKLFQYANWISGGEEVTPLRYRIFSN